jgi:hypothetical protein
VRFLILQSRDDFRGFTFPRTSRDEIDGDPYNCTDDAIEYHHGSRVREEIQCCDLDQSRKISGLCQKRDEKYQETHDRGKSFPESSRFQRGFLFRQQCTIVLGAEALDVVRFAERAPAKIALANARLHDHSRATNLAVVRVIGHHGDPLVLHGIITNDVSCNKFHPLHAHSISRIRIFPRIMSNLFGRRLHGNIQISLFFP